MSGLLDVIVVGEALVDFLPDRRGRLRDVGSFAMHSGGAPANVAIGAARLGARVGYVGVVGEDEFGHFLRQSLEREGVDCERVRHAREAKTGLSFVALDEQGERSFLFYSHPSADMLLSPEDVPAAYLARAGILHFGTNSLVLPPGVEAVRLLVKQRDRALISLDPNLRLHLWTDRAQLRAYLQELVPSCHLVKCSADEVALVTGEADPRKAARALVERGVSLAVVTLGAEGALWARAADEGRVAAPRVEVVDATGAGDGFMAALLVRVAQERAAGVGPETIPRDRLEAHVAYACRVGAAVVRKLGAVAGLPREGEALP